MFKWTGTVYSHFDGCFKGNFGFGILPKDASICRLVDLRSSTTCQQLDIFKQNTCISHLFLLSGKISARNPERDIEGYLR